MHFRSEEMGKFYNYISHDTTSLLRHEQVCLSRGKNHLVFAEVTDG